MKKTYLNLLTSLGTTSLLLVSAHGVTAELNTTLNTSQLLAQAPGANPGGAPPQGAGGPPGAGQGGPGGAGGPPPSAPGGEGSPGALGSEGGDAASSEPLVPKAQSQFADFASAQHADAVILVTDFNLLDACKLSSGAIGFCPNAPLTVAELAAAVSKATSLVSGVQPKDNLAYAIQQGWLPKQTKAQQSATGYDVARSLLIALGVTPPNNTAAIDTELKQHDLKQGLNAMDFSQAITRDDAAQMLTNALKLSDGSGALPIVKHNSPINAGSGKLVVDNTAVFQFGSSAVQDADSSVLVVRNSHIEGDSSAATKSLSGPPSGLMIAGSIRTTLALSQSQAFYLNSSVVSKDWAAWSTDGAVPVTQDGQKELSLYGYGSRATTRVGGYGVYSDLFCNAYLYGSTVQAAEVGVISGTYGRITIGTIGDGEANAALAEQLTAADKQQQGNKQLGSTIIGGRNALLVHSVSLPPYWGFKGYSQTELPLHSAQLSIHGGSLSTDLSLDKHAEYSALHQAYIKHVAGSVILIRSSNADLDLQNVQLNAGKGGTGAVLHTIINNDTRFMVKVPDGETYPGNKVNMSAMTVQGDVINEDYQRDLALSLKSSSLSGKIVSATVAQWNASAQAGGFAEYAIDANGYNTAHGVNLSLDSTSSWTVTGNSSLRGITIEKGAKLLAPRGKTLTLLVNGMKTAIQPGSYNGNVQLTIS